MNSNLCLVFFLPSVCQFCYSVLSSLYFTYNPLFVYCFSTPSSHLCSSAAPFHIICFPLPTSCSFIYSFFFIVILHTFLPLSISPSHAAGGEDGEARERDEIRHDRRKERQHDRNISRAAPDKRCWTRTLNSPHVNSPPVYPQKHCWIIHGAAVILSKCSRILQSTQTVVFTCNDPQTVCAHQNCCQCVFLCWFCELSECQ